MELHCKTLNFKKIFLSYIALPYVMYQFLSQILSQQLVQHLRSKQSPELPQEKWLIYCNLISFHNCATLLSHLLFGKEYCKLKICNRYKMHICFSANLRVGFLTNRTEKLKLVPLAGILYIIRAAFKELFKTCFTLCWPQNSLKRPERL